MSKKIVDYVLFQFFYLTRKEFLKATWWYYKTLYIKYKKVKCWANLDIFVRQDNQSEKSQQKLNDNLMMCENSD